MVFTCQRLTSLTLFIHLFSHKWFWTHHYSTYMTPLCKLLLMCSWTVRGQVKVIQVRSKQNLWRDTLSPSKLLPVCSDIFVSFSALILQLCEKVAHPASFWSVKALYMRNITIQHHKVSRRGLFVYLFYSLLNRNIVSSCAKHLKDMMEKP